MVGACHNRLDTMNTIRKQKDYKKEILDNMEKLKKIKKKIKILLISLLTVLLFLTVGFGAYVGNYYHATETAEEAIVAT